MKKNHICDNLEIKKKGKDNNPKMRRNKRGHKPTKAQEIANLNQKTVKYLSIGVGILITMLLVIIIIYQANQYFNHQNFLKEVNETLEQAQAQNNKETEEQVEIKEPTSTTFTLTAIGDIMCHNTQYMDAYQKEEDQYNFSYVFENINRYIKTSDIAIGSLETSFAGKEKGYSNYPTFNSPDDLAYDLKKLGIDVLTTAGNHCLDMGFDGLSRTIDVLDAADISHVGTYQTQEDRDKILFKYVKGIKIAILNYTYGTNGIPIPSGKEFSVNLINKEQIQKDIKSAKEHEAQSIISCMHWGTEYRTTANEEQKELADFLFQNGVDIILGNHPHVLEPMEKRTITLEDGTTKDGFIIYALGNFICDQNAENTRNSIILNLKITKQVEGKITIDKAEYIPIYMYKDTSMPLRKMKILDIKKEIENYETDQNNGVKPAISQALYNNLKTQLQKITTIVGPEIK